MPYATASLSQIATSRMQRQGVAKELLICGRNRSAADGTPLLAHGVRASVSLAARAPERFARRAAFGRPGMANDPPPQSIASGLARAGLSRGPGCLFAQDRRRAKSARARGGGAAPQG